MYDSIDELQKDVDKWLLEYNGERTHTGKHCYGKTPLQTFAEAKHLATEKMIGENKLPHQKQKEEIESLESREESQLCGQGVVR